MAIADFFGKVALAASQVLQGLDHAALAAALEAAPVGVAFDGRAAKTPEGRVTLHLVVNFLARLYPRLALVPLAGGELAACLTAEARAINPRIDIDDDLARACAVVAVGETPIAAAAPIVYIGSAGWVARLSPNAPVGSGDSANPFGAAAAACFGAANLFRLCFAAHLPEGDPDGPFSLSLVDLLPNAPRPANPALVPIDLGETFLVGLGAIGNAATWALARVPGLSGALHLIDGEPVDHSNLQRYALTTQRSVGEAKVTLAEAALAGTKIAAHPHPMTWGDYLRSRADWSLERVAVAVDSEEDRRAIQAALPRWVVNAWTQPGDLGISRHPFLGEDACLACLYFPAGVVPSEDQLVAGALGLPEALMEIRQLLHSGAPVGQTLLDRAAAALGVPVEPLLPFADRPLRDFYTGAICGGIVLALGGDSTIAPPATTPLAFQSALAGVMLAAELVAHAGGLRPEPVPATTRIDLLRPLGTRLSIPARKHPTGRCICQDADYIARYRAKYVGS